MICSFACSQIFTVVYGLYFFEVIGKTTADCYYVEGSKVAMTKATATTFGKANNKTPVNVTANFDFILMLGWWQCAVMLSLPIAFILMTKIPMLGGAIAGIAGCAAMVMGVMQYVCVFMYRGTEGGSVCAGGYIKKDLTASQKAVVMTSKGQFLMFLLVMQWISVASCACSCLCMVVMCIRAKMG